MPKSNICQMQSFNCWKPHVYQTTLVINILFQKLYIHTANFKSACFSELLKTPVVSNTSVHLCLSCNLNSHYSSQLLCFFVGGKSRGKDKTAPVRWEMKWNSPLATSTGNSDHNEQCHVHTSIPLLRQCPLSWTSSLHNPDDKYHTQIKTSAQNWFCPMVKQSSQNMALQKSRADLLWYNYL